MKLGLDGVAYASADLHQDEPNPTFLELDLIEEIDQEFTKANATVGNRRSRFTKHSGGQITFAYTLTMTYHRNDAGFDLLYNALVSGDPIGLAVMDADMTDDGGSEGWILDAEVFDGPKAESLNEFDKVAFVCRPSAKSTFDPERLVIPPTP
jgi:hypothetical protein